MLVYIKQYTLQATLIPPPSIQLKFSHQRKQAFVQFSNMCNLFLIRSFAEPQLVIPMTYMAGFRYSGPHVPRHLCNARLCGHVGSALFNSGRCAFQLGLTIFVKLWKLSIKHNKSSDWRATHAFLRQRETLLLRGDEGTKGPALLLARPLRKESVLRLVSPVVRTASRCEVYFSRKTTRQRDVTAFPGGNSWRISFVFFCPWK